MGVLRRGVVAILIQVVVVLLQSSSCKALEDEEDDDTHCPPSSCGDIHNISYPFRLQGDPNKCGHPNYELACENNRTVLYLYSGRYYVKAINYRRFTVRVVDSGLVDNNCSALPLYSLAIYNFSYLYPYKFRHYNVTAFVFLSCAAPVNSTLYVEVDYYPAHHLCTQNHIISSNSVLPKPYTYVAFWDWPGASVMGVSVSDVKDSCTIDAMTWASKIEPWNTSSFLEIRKRLVVNGFDIWWYGALCGDCEKGGGYCELEPDDFAASIDCLHPCEWGNYPFLLFIRHCVLFYWTYHHMSIYKDLAFYFSARYSIGILLVLALSIYKWRRRHLSVYDTIEDFLSHNNLSPIRYTYSDIKKMTQGFKDKLGEGGYGNVYKGKLRSGLLVAVKIMSKSKATGQEFINEVATIGRIHNVNVVTLVGFCAEGSKRALVYDFMPNGSLDKYIFPQKETTLCLSCKKMYEISLGVARGIEYLHRGCDMQILHFDIKPHNILLDENFTPKVSDFGLAKLYSTDDSIVSLTAARGTMGYMAPELFYKNIGGVSYKADVYSFGMLLMEMAGRRKNLNPFVDHLSQIHFPSWVYDQFNEGKDIEIGDSTEEERKMVKKMIIVALWCIQFKPCERPSMNRVVEMLEGNVEDLQMPSKPFLSPEEMPAEEIGINTDDPELPLLSDDAIDSISLEIESA